MPQTLKDFIESGAEEFENKFPAMGIAGDLKDNCIYRFDQYKKDKSQLLEWHNFRTTQAYELGKQETLAMVMREIEDEDKRWNENGEHYANVSQALSTLKQKLSGNGE